MDLGSFSCADLATFVVVGVLAQLVRWGSWDGIWSRLDNLLVSLGMPPATASPRVHVAETFTTAASGTSHIYYKNVDWRLFTRLAIPGVIGGVLGAYILT